MKTHRVLTSLTRVTIILICCLLYSSGTSTMSCDQENDNCEDSGSKEECYNSTLEQLPERMDDNTSIVLCSSDISLATSVLFSSLHNISITGTSSTNTTTITCSAENAGLIFRECHNVAISNITIRGCGSQYTNESDHHGYMSSLYVLNSTNVTLFKVNITNSNGNGLIMMDNYGRVDVVNCTFENNRLAETNYITETTVMGGGGVFIDITSPHTAESESFNTKDNTCKGEKLYSAYRIENCHFMNNTASKVNNNLQNLSHLGQRLERGGGLNVAIRNSAKYNSIKISNGLFYNNSAIWGGGLYVVYHISPENNTVEITGTKFIQNHCSTVKGGGGASIGYAFFHNDLPHNNKIVFMNCWFARNRAKFAGGISLYSSRSTHSIVNNMFQFINCTWIDNQAQYGSAVTALPQVWDAMKSGFLPTTIFSNCTFTSNTIIAEMNQTNGVYTFYQNGEGAFLISRFTIEFQGVTTFTGSNGSALYVTSGIVKFAQGSETTFYNNTGTNGGAISLHGFSAIYVKDNSNIVFKGNSATNRGGAIFYYSFNKQDYTFSRSCFIQYEGEEKDKDKRNLTVEFSDNVARIGTNESSKSELNFGNAVFATNLRPCVISCSLFSRIQNYCNNETTDNYNIYNHPFTCIGNFIFESGTHEIATAGQGFCTHTDDPYPLKVIPGKELKVPVTLYDDLDHNAWAIYHVSIENQTANNNQITIDKRYTYTQNTTIKLYGNPGSRGRIKIATLGARDIAVSFDVELQQCPPGFIIYGSESERKCVCSASKLNQNNKMYMGVHSCDEINFRAYITRGFWIGYVEDSETENSLYSGHCPNAFCFHNHTHDESNKNMLTSEASKQDLDKLVCGENRTGILCGKCRANYSVFYHNNYYHCYKDNHCNWGPVLYIVSELLPVSILFIIVTIFNIPFTSGAVNGALFFIQVINTMQTNEFITIPSSKLHDASRILHDIIYRSFNLNFFTIRELSFCLFKGATPLDVIAFKYVTIVYSLLLVVLTVVIVRLCSYRRLHSNRRKRTRSPNLQSSIIHGLSAFFVMTYSLCTRVSLALLTPGHVRILSTHNKIKVAFYNGDLNFLQGEHIKYAVPAMIFTIIFILIPPFLLIIYPLCYRIFALLGIGETRCVQVTCKIIPLERLKPLFDSFQGSFKDEYRFFAGLYFLYRLVALTGFAFNSSITRFYTSQEMLLILMLTFHSIAQPYKKQWHNIMDTLLFSNLAIINRLSIHNYKRFLVKDSYQGEINTITLIQAFLTALPFLYIATYAVVQTILRVKRHCCKNTTDKEEDWIAMSDHVD